MYPKDTISELKGKRYCNSLRTSDDQYKNGVTGYDLVLYVTERWGAGMNHIYMIRLIVDGVCICLLLGQID